MGSSIGPTVFMTLIANAWGFYCHRSWFFCIWFFFCVCVVFVCVWILIFKVTGTSTPTVTIRPFPAACGGRDMTISSLIIINCLSILSIFHSFDNKYHGIINGRQSSCVASRSSVGVYCHHWPLTAGVSRAARAPALIPLSARLRTAVPETGGDWTLPTPLRAPSVQAKFPSVGNKIWSRGYSAASS